MPELFIIIVFIFLLWFWWDSLGSRESARQAGKQICDKNDVQFLDDSVSVSRIAVQRDRSGKMGFRREYSFEFSYSGEERSFGRVTTLGRRVVKVEIELKQF